MTIPSSSSQTENFTKHRTPFFTGTDYPYWKTRMTWYLQSTDLDVWDVIENGPTLPTKLVDGVLVPKPKQELNELDRKKFQLNAKVVFTLQVLWIEMKIIEYVNASRLKKFGDCLK